MSDIISILKRTEYRNLIEKMISSEKPLTGKEYSIILFFAITSLKQFSLDHRHVFLYDFAYYIILKYAQKTHDYKPLYDLSINYGLYPLATSLKRDGNIIFYNIHDSLLDDRIITEFSLNNKIETFEQNKNKKWLLDEKEREICYVAPTSFGKTSLIVDDIRAHNYKRIGIIEPTKLLLNQTYKLVKKADLNYKILLHDEMYRPEYEKYLAVFTQERALRLLEKNDTCFDVLYIDEAHLLFGKDYRAILLVRLLKKNGRINSTQKVVYLSPLINDAESLRVYSEQRIVSRHILANMKEPEYYEFLENGTVRKFNQFFGTFVTKENNKKLFPFLLDNCKEKNLFYLNSPMKIEIFSNDLAHEIQTINNCEEINKVIHNLEKYVHKYFIEIDLLKKGIIYLHGKLPENIKEYLEYKFETVPEIKYLVANKVILEGMNLPIDQLFIMNTWGLNITSIINLVGRVNRLNNIFTKEITYYDKLLPQIFFVNTEKYNKKNSEMENKIRLLQKNILRDKIENPILVLGDKKSDNAKKMIENENIIFQNITDPIILLKKSMISLGMSNIYTLCDDLIRKIYNRIQRKDEYKDLDTLEIVKKVFIDELVVFIIDDEFKRLQNEAAINYYRVFFKNRENPLNKNIQLEVSYLQGKKQDGDFILYAGRGYGNIDALGQFTPGGAYISIQDKTIKELVNFSIQKIKVEQDFISYKMNMFFQLMKDYEIIDIDKYNLAVYGTNNSKELAFIKEGLPINIIKKIESDNQFSNVGFDNNNNITINKLFRQYMNTKDDFYKFELTRYFE
ncbi:MAG: DEAD/DEAH box helicase family protein [Eubacteriales bacterium]